MQTASYLTLVEILEMTRPYEECAPIIRRVLDRLAVEGVPGLASMHFYHDAERAQLGAVITFSDASQILAHTAMISQWEDFRLFASMIKVIEMRVHGKLSPESRKWLAQFKGPIRVIEEYVGGFVR